MSGLLRKTFSGLLLIILLFPDKSPAKYCPPPTIIWKQLSPGLFAAEVKGPHTSKFPDSKVTIIKIDPAYFNFEMVVATESDSTLHTIKDWCEMKNLMGAINAGMYSLKDHITSIGYMQNYNHINNPSVKENLNALAVFNPKDKTLPSFQIIDMKNQDWKAILKNYNCCFQSIRMIDNNGEAVYWKNRHTLRCSMTVLATDKSGNVLFLFSRSPYSANEFINFMLNSGLNIQTAMYLEGGPEASIYAKTTDGEILKFGSYVSRSNPNDDNTELRKMPNILGFRNKVNN